MTISEAVKGAFAAITGGEKKEEKKEEKAPVKKDVKEDNKEDGEDDEDEEKEDKKEKEPADKKSDDKKEDKPVDKDKPLIDQRTRDAVALLDLIENPDSAAEVIQMITNRAKKAGAIKEDTTVKKQKEIVVDLLEELKATTQPEFHDLLDGLGPALKAAVKAAVNESEIKISDLQRQLKTFTNNAEVETYKAKIGSILAKDKYEPYLETMGELAKKFAPQDGMKEEDFFEELYELAVAKKGKIAASKTKEEKAKKNKEEEIPSSSSKTSAVVVMNRKPTLGESIKAAKEGREIKVQQG